MTIVSDTLCIDGHFEGLLGHRLAEAKGRFFRLVKASGAMQPYRQTRCAPLCCMIDRQDLLVKEKEVDALGIKD